jgi:hypothetical protein
VTTAVNEEPILQLPVLGLWCRWPFVSFVGFTKVPLIVV